MGTRMKPNAKAIKKKAVIRWRKEGMTQKEIAEKLSLNLSTVCRWLKAEGMTGTRKKKVLTKTPEKKTKGKSPKPCRCKEKVVVRSPVPDPDVAAGFKKAESLRHLLLAMGAESPSVPELVKALAILDLLEKK